MRSALWLGMLLMLMAAGPAWAHRLSIEWEVRGGELVVKAGAEGEPASGADVELRKADGLLVGVGRMDDAGMWVCDLTGAGEYTLAVDAGLGHRRTVDLNLAAVALEGQEATNVVTAGAGVDGVMKGSTDSGPGLGWRAVFGVALVFMLAGLWMWWSRGRRREQGGGR